MTRLMLVGVGVLVLAAACGGDGGGDRTSAGLEAAARRQAEAFLRKDWRTAYNAFTKECRESLPYSEFASQMTVGVALIESFSGFKWKDIAIDSVEVRDVAGDEGDVVVRLVGPDGEEFGGDGDVTHWIFEDGEWRNADCSGFEDGGLDDDEAVEDEPATGPGSSRAEPAPPGTTLRLNGWDITVRHVEPDATRTILAANEFNEPPAEGRQFFLVEIEATYSGDDESSSFYWDITLKALGPSNVAYDSADGCGAIPDELDEFRDVFQGGTIRGNVCWSVLASDAPELLMYAEPAASFNASRRWWLLR